MFCPSCGADIPADRRFARLVVCRYCDSAIIWDEKAARISGKMAVLAQTAGPLFTGATGVLYDRRFTVLGRVRYGYERGFWDEWYLAFEDGATAWISEDENNFTLESCIEEELPSIDFALVVPGSELTLGDTTYHLDEKGVADCEGGEGQLPFPVLSGEKVPFLDLSRGERFATIEFDPDDGGARVFRGRRIDISDVKLDMTADEAGVTPSAALSAEREAGKDKRERIVRRDDRSKDIKCYACGGPLTIPDPGAKSITCSYCSAELDLTLRRVTCPNCSATVPMHGGVEAKSVVCRQCESQINVSKPEPSLLGTVLSDKRPQVPFSLGQECRFDGVKYHLVGHVRMVQRDAWGVYRFDEYLLYSKERGYRWLTSEEGHFSLALELDDRPVGFDPRRCAPKSKFSFLDKKWTVFEQASHVVEWVDGELPWVSKVGDSSHYMDAIAPPYLLSAEWTETEMEWFLAEYVTREQVAEAFGIPVDSLRRPIGVAPNQPFSSGPARRQSVAVLAVSAVVFALFGLLALLSNGRQVADMSIAARAYAEEYITSSFEITEPNALCKATFRAPVNNSWVYLDVAVINERDEAVLDFSAQMSYYHGVEGGESWSEGSGKDSVAFKLKEPGEYRLLLLGQAGTGAQAGSLSSAGKTVAIAVYEGAKLARYHLVIAALCGCWVAIELLRRASFEKQRWNEDEDDDD